MSNKVYIATSIDGFIATPNGGLKWLEEIPNPDKSDFGFSEFVSGIDAIIMGRKTFDKVLSFNAWPYDKPVFVLSNLLKNVPLSLEGCAEIIKGDIKEIISDLNAKGFRNLYIDGGKVIQSFLKRDLIDEMIISQVPIILGNGIPLFGVIDRKLNFKLIKSEVFNSSLVKNYYQRDRG